MHQVFDRFSRSTMYTVTILLMAAVYFFTAKAGQIFAFHPENVTPVWFPSAVIFFAVYYKGYSVLPGVFVGAAVGNGWAYASFDSPSSTFNTLLAAGLNGAGDVSCAVIGVYFLKKMTTLKKLFTEINHLVVFLALSVLAGPLVSATAGVGGLYAAGIVSELNLWTVFFTWVVGDAAGVLLLGPLLVLLYQNNWSLKAAPGQFYTAVFVFLVLTGLAHTPLTDYVSSLHSLIVIIPVLIYFLLKYNAVSTFFFATLASTGLLTVTAFENSYSSKFNFNLSMINIQLFIFLTFTTLLFFSVLINRIREKEHQNTVQQNILLQRSRMATIGEMLSAILHQWMQPLNTISLTLGLVKEEQGSKIDYEELDEYIRIMNNQIRFMVETVNDFKSFFKPLKSKTSFNPEEQLKQVYNMFSHVFTRSNTDLVINNCSEITCMGYPSEFMQVILNIFINATDNFEARGIKNGVIDCMIEKDSEQNTIRIRDNGGGIDNSLLPDRLFQYNISTKGDKGTGIGLYISKLIIENHMNGQLRALNTDQGAEFIIELPVA